MARRRVSDTHVIWAYDSHIWDWYASGLSAVAIQEKLREVYLHVGVQAVRDVIAVAPRDIVRRRAAGSES